MSLCPRILRRTSVMMKLSKSLSCETRTPSAARSPRASCRRCRSIPTVWNDDEDAKKSAQGPVKCLFYSPCQCVMSQFGSFAKMLFKSYGFSNRIILAFSSTLSLSYILCLQLMWLSFGISRMITLRE